MQTILKIQSICWLHFSLRGFICNSIGRVVWEGAGCHLAFQILSSSHNSQLIFQSLSCVGGVYTTHWPPHSSLASLFRSDLHIDNANTSQDLLCCLSSAVKYWILQLSSDHSLAELSPVVSSILRVPRGGCLGSWVMKQSYDLQWGTKVWPSLE